MYWGSSLLFSEDYIHHRRVLASSTIITASIHLSSHRSIHPFYHWSIYSSIHRFIHLSVHPSIHLSYHRSIHLSIHPSISIEWLGLRSHDRVALFMTRCMVSLASCLLSSLSPIHYSIHSSLYHIYALFPSNLVMSTVYCRQLFRRKKYKARKMKIYNQF